MMTFTCGSYRVRTCDPLLVRHEIYWLQLVSKHLKVIVNQQIKKIQISFETIKNQFPCANGVQILFIFDP
jgi:hypothetical protein